MQTLSGCHVGTELLNRRSWRQSSSLRALLSSSDYSNQSRGSLPRFFSHVLPSSKGGIVCVHGDEFWHITKVLRLTTNDRLELFDGKGGLVEGCIQAIERTTLYFLALKDPDLIPPRGTQWHVYASFGSLKGGRTDWLIEKCTELGASSVTPLLTVRSPSVSEIRIKRLERVIVAATKQCQRLHGMTLNPPQQIGSILPAIARSHLSFVAIAEATPIIKALTSLRVYSGGLIIVGPEGDFTKEEVHRMMDAGAIGVGLGPHRLRVETATVTLLATLMLWSDAKSPFPD